MERDTEELASFKWTDFVDPYWVERLRRQFVAEVTTALRERGEHACGGFQDDVADWIEREF